MAKPTGLDIYNAEEKCAFLHRKLGMKQNKGTATRADYKRAAAAVKALDKIWKPVR